jgi:drug/metabolite transporter (DMT)-like permease
MSKIVVFSIAIALGVATSIGDILIKKGSLSDRLIYNWRIYAAGFIYFLTAFGWFFVLKRMKLSMAVMVYTVCLLLIVVSVSIFYFKEKLNPLEYLGIMLAFISVLILYRFL